ncbi:MAG: phosphatase PAP2 family protein [Lachnospiraceae bacterium]|nr:phosphatase PAP2 family protein [Lachnospiraceae bacterium]MDE6253188.1 phosphatase PAP2 family protein [Lachnospiraceae bacterium]
MDMEILNLLTNIRTPVLTWINLALSILGEGTVFIAIFCLIFWCIDKKFAYRLGILYVISGLMIQTTKIIFRIPRPWIKDPSFHIVEEARNSATGYSFPSGHTQNVTALYSALAFKSNRRAVKILCFLVIFLVMFSRMYLGVHTPTDVIVSFLLTLTISVFIYYYGENYSVDYNHLSVLLVLLFLLPLAAIGTCVYVYLNVPDVITENLIDVIKSSGAAFGFLIGWLIERKYICFNENATTLPFQILKYIIGLIVLILLNYIFGLITDTLLNGFLPAYFISNMILLLFIVCIYPIFIKKCFTDEYYL